jgi:mono/diheme cytochrome c family protein
MALALERRSLPVALLFLLFFVALWRPALAQQTPPFDPDSVPVPANPPVSALAETSYAQNCAPCHGAEGNSDGPTVAELPAPPPSFADPETTWAPSPAEYFHTIKFGRMQNLMPPWRNQLSDTEIWQVTYYAMSLHTDPAAVAGGETLYAASCASCHGDDGRGDGPDAEGEIPDLSDQAALIRVSNAGLSQTWNDAHAEIGNDWSSAERRNVIDYMRTFTYVPPWELPYEEGEGAIQGTLTQGTPDGSEPSDVPVTLFGFLNFTQVMSATTTSAADGSFQFQGLSTDPEIAYIVEADYADVGYTSEFLRLSPDAPIQELTLNVYEFSDDDSGLVVSRANWILDHQPGELLAGVIMVYSNRNEATYSGTTIEGADRPVTLAIPMPPEAIDLQFPDGVLGGRYLRIGDMIWDTASVPPGEEIRQVFVSYRLPYDGDSISIDQRWVYPVDSLNLLVADLPDLTVEAEPLTFMSNDTLEGVEFQLWNGEALPAETIVTADLAGLLTADTFDPRLLADEESAEAAGMPTASTPPLEPWVPIAIGALAALAMGVMLVLYMGKAASPTAMLADERDELVRQIAELDDRHAKGELDDATWTRQRAQLKGRLLETARELTVLQETSG